MRFAAESSHRLEQALAREQSRGGVCYLRRYYFKRKV